MTYHKSQPPLFNLATQTQQSKPEQQQVFDHAPNASHPSLPKKPATSQAT